MVFSRQFRYDYLNFYKQGIIMKIKSLMAVLVLVFGVSACSTVKKVVYRIDVPQGNYLEQEKIDQLEIGMNQEQVQYLLGAPVLKDSFANQRWSYVFIQREGHNDPIQQTLFVYFDQRGLVSDVQIAQPATAQDIIEENGAVESIIHEE